MRQCLLLVLVGTLLALTPLAHGAPPDPTWISGFYDDADFDDVVQALTASSAVVSSGPTVALDVAVPIGLASFDEEGHPPAARPSPHPPRAPPDR